MYIKRIICDVKENMRSKFSFAQEKWIRTPEAEGFIAQTGGWNSQNKNEACIISFWESKEYLLNFMIKLHDQITDYNQQAAAYNKINVIYFNSNIEIKTPFSLIKNTVKSVEIMRLEEFQINLGKDLLFEKIAKEVWASGMDKSTGLFSGVFLKSEENALKYLMLTFGNQSENYKKYERSISSELKIRNEISGAILKTKIRQIIPVDSWKIIKQ